MSTLDKRLRRTRTHMTKLKDTTFTMQGAFKVLAGGAALGFAGAKLFELGAAVEETASKFKTALGPAAGEAQKFLDSFASTAGLTNTKAQDLVATTASIAQGMGFAQHASAGMAIEVTKLAADISSYNNIPIEQTSLAITSALTGERESLKRLGIVVREVDVQQRAMALSGKTVAGALTQQEKVTATMSLITERAGVAVGDLGRTMDSPANRARFIVAEFLTLRDTIASKLLPVFGVLLEELASLAGNEGLAGLTTMLERNQTRLVNWSKFAVASIKAVVVAFVGLFRIAFNVGELMANTLQVAFFIQTKQLGKAIGAARAFKTNLFDLGDTIADVGRKMVEAGVAYDIAIATTEDLADETTAAAAGLNAMAAAAERAAATAMKVVAMTIEENRHFAEQRDLIEEIQEKLREQQRVRDERVASPISFLDSINTRTSTSTGTPDLGNAFEGATDFLGKVRDQLKDFGKSIGSAGSALNPLELLLKAVHEALGDFLVSMTPIIEVLAKALMPILKALFPVLKLVTIVATYFGQVMLNVAGGLAIAIGSIIKAIGKAIDKIPFVSGKGIIRAGEGMKKFGRGALESAGALASARDQIKAMEWQEAASGVDHLDEAAKRAAAALVEAARKLESMEKITVRALRAMGDTAGADRQSLTFGHRRELAGAAPADVEALETLHAMEKLALHTQQAIDKISAAAADQVELLGAGMRLQERELQTAQEQLTVQEQTVESLTGLVARLRDFGDSLRLGSLSPLSIPQKFAEASSQLDALRLLAVGGDTSAAESIPDAIRTFLELARKMFASGPGFVDAFDKSEKILGEVGAAFGTQLTVEEKMLAQLEQQTAQLAAALQLTQAQIQAVNDGAARQIAEIRASADAQLLELGLVLQKVTGILLDSELIDAHTKQTAANTGAELLHAKQLVLAFERDVIPALHSGYQVRLDAKDAAHLENITNLAREFNRQQEWVPGIREEIREGFSAIGLDIVRAGDQG